jgi:hypothetical protein
MNLHPVTAALQPVAGAPLQGHETGALDSSMFMKTGWIAGLLLLPGAVPAKDISGEYAVHGVGGEPCSLYLETRAAGGGRLLEYEIWLAGYFSAFNLIVSNTYSIMGDRDMAHFLDALDQYCADQPGELFVSAISNITMLVFPERHNLSPHVNRWPSLLEDP